MKAIENSIIIDRPLADVFSYISQYENDPRWRHGVSLMKQNTLETELGTETDEVLDFMGSRYNTRGKIVEYVPNSKSAFQSIEGTLPVTGWRLVEVADGGTRFTMHLEPELQGAMVLMGPLRRAAFSRQMRGDLQTLKHILET